jgi:hypothetical protein
MGGATLLYMTESEIEKCRNRLEQFLADLLEPLGRRERRYWSSVYVRGLLLDGERKSIEPMAGRLPEGNVQAMQQLIGQSPWPWAPVWERLARRMSAELSPDPVWVIDDTGFPKQGHHSVGVARQYSGTLGKTANCQVAVSLHQAGAEESTILDWRLYLPESWVQDPQRRAEAGIPEAVKFRTKWQLALELIDEALVWGLRGGVVLADAAYGEVTEFRDGLEARQRPYVVGIPSSLGVWAQPPRMHKLQARGRGRPPSVYHYGDTRPPRFERWRRRPGDGSKSAGEKVRKAGWSRASTPAASDPRTVSTKASHPIRRSGCWWNGRAARGSPRNTFSATCHHTTRCGDWCASPKVGGRSNGTINNSRRSWGWITTKAAIGRAGIIM